MTAAPIPIRRDCGHASIDVDKLLTDDRLAAALTAPLVPGTTGNDLHLWTIKLYRRTHRGAATVEGACALLHRHPLTSDKHKATGAICVAAQALWTTSNESENLTDIGNARRLATLSGTDITHDPVAGWRIWTGDHWRGDPDGTVIQRWAKGVHKLIDTEADRLYARARAAADREGAEAETEAEKLNRQAGQTKAWALKSQNLPTITAMGKLLRDEPGVLTRTDAWDADGGLLAFPGVTVELTPDGHRLRPPRRSDRITKVGRAVPGTGQATPLLTAFLDRFLPDPEVRDYVQRLMGYGQVAGNPDRLFPIFIGPTSGGKSTFSETVRHVLGEHAGTYNLSLFRGKQDEGPRQDLVKAMDRRMIFTSEAGQRWKLHADEVKRLTGNDSVAARDLYAKKDASVERQPAFMPVLCCNHPPTVVGADAATWRRLIAVPWPVTISEAEEDGNFGERIRAEEANGVLDWLLHGYDMYCALGLKDPPMAVVEATMKLREELTVADHWWVAETRPVRNAWSATDDLWERFRKWCSYSGFSDADRDNKIIFGRWLGERPGLTPKWGKRVITKYDEETGEPHSYEVNARGWQGVRLIDPEADEESHKGGNLGGFADHGVAT